MEHHIIRYHYIIFRIMAEFFLASLRFRKHLVIQRRPGYCSTICLWRWTLSSLEPWGSCEKTTETKVRQEAETSCGLMQAFINMTWSYMNNILRHFIFILRLTEIMTLMESHLCCLAKISVFPDALKTMKQTKHHDWLTEFFWSQVSKGRSRSVT